jgi:hypothetical protein
MDEDEEEDPGIRVYKRRVPLFAALQISEENRELLEGLEGVRAVQDGHYVVRGTYTSSRIAAPGQWIVTAHLEGGYWELLEERDFQEQYEEAGP